MQEESAYLSEVFKSSKAASATSFVRKLYTLVACESDEIVCFLPDGSAFEVKDPKKLEAEVLPKYFRHSRFQSFVRQLNFYNFKKTNKERSMWIYKHELFHRDRPDLLDKLKRKTSTGETRRLQRSTSGDSVDSPRNANWQALVQSGSESFLKLSHAGSEDVAARNPGMSVLPPPVPSHVIMPRSYEDHSNMFRLQLPAHQPQRPGKYHIAPQPSHVPCQHSPKGGAPSSPPQHSYLAAHRSPQWQPSAPPALFLQRNRSSDIMQTSFTDDEADDGDETDGSSASSWDTLGSSTEDVLSLGLLGEIDMTNDFVEQLANTMLHACPSLSQAALSTILFCVQGASLALQDPEEVRSKALQFLSDTPEVNQELRAYRAALDPSIVYDQVRSSPESRTAKDPVTRRLLLLQGSFDRSRVVRDFIAFSLMCIQGLRDRWNLEACEPKFLKLFEDCQRVWKRVAARLA